MRPRAAVWMVWMVLVVTAACRHRGTPSCERSVAGIEPYIQRGAIAWFGEMHGTEESPRFVGDVVCHAVRVGRVQLGLEIWNAEQSRIDAYMNSDGAAADRAALLDGAFWRNHDGRSTEAMLALLERMRALSHAGATIDIVAYDVPDAPDREGAMAEFVAKERDANAVFVALSGNFHSRRTKGALWDPELVPTVARLVERGLAVTSFDVSSNGGMNWGCMLKGPGEPRECGEHPNRREPGEPWTLGPARDSSHDGIYRVGATVASKPARP
jgi:hypothetical protein